MNLQQKRDLYNGFGDTLARAFEIVVTPLLFGLFGHFIDGAAGTSPVFTIVLFLLAVVGLAVKLYYGYVEEMKVHEARLPGARGLGGRDNP